MFGTQGSTSQPQMEHQSPLDSVPEPDHVSSMVWIPIGPAFCDDVRIQRNLNLGFLACDPSLPYRNYATSFFDETKITEDGALWMYDLSKVRQCDMTKTRTLWILWAADVMMMLTELSLLSLARIACRETGYQRFPGSFPSQWCCHCTYL